jgi:hypothetical protein
MVSLAINGVMRVSVIPIALKAKLQESGLEKRLENKVRP